jgi:Domain of unknown function (DUF6259)
MGAAVTIGAWLPKQGHAGSAQASVHDADPASSEEIVLTGSLTRIEFSKTGTVLRLKQIQREGHPPLLYSGGDLHQAGVDALGNPMAVVVLSGPNRGSYGMDTFRITKFGSTGSRLLVYLTHKSLPLQTGLDIAIQGDVIEWRGQAIWNGADDVDVDFYFPLLSRVQLAGPGHDRLIAGELSGTARGPLDKLNFSQTYLGGLSTPAFLLDGGDRGLAFLEDSRADFAADPAGCRQRSAVIGTVFPMEDNLDVAIALPKGDAGPFAGWRHRRLLLGTSRFGGQAEYDKAESHGTLPMAKLGDSVDMGPVLSYAYEGPWKAGAIWLRERRQMVPMRTSPAEWYRDTTFLAEESPDGLLRAGRTLYDLPLVLTERRGVGSDMLSLPGFSEPEILGTEENMLNRGDYFYPAENLGGLEAMRRGVEAAHRQGGHVLLYVEGLIVWKRSRIGRSKAGEWALMNADGTLTENYRGFFDMCPAERGWQDWFATTLADVVRETGVDGFFMDSMLATDNHRCFNPKHAHAPQPDIWNWGLRQVLRRVREEVDKANPNTILLCEGVGDMAREYIDGTLSHGHAWTGMKFTVPLLRFLHPQMRAFEAWGMEPRGRNAPPWPVAKPLLWNAVNGYRVFAELESQEQLAPLGRMVRRYYDMYPEICDAPVSVFDIDCPDAWTQLFESLPRVLTAANPKEGATKAQLTFPAEVQSGLLFDRCTGKTIPVRFGKAEVDLAPWEFRAFELRA